MFYSIYLPQPEIKKIVDVDKTLLEFNTARVRPLLSDFLKRRNYPLKIEVYQGSIDSPNEVLKHTDAILAIEIIEHLYPDVLENVPYNIFGFIQPKIAIFTTPNCEFNVLFDMNLPNRMRHLDHKFEWTRSQFRDWAQNICRRFPKYVVSVFGVGNGPPEHKHIGKVSQMAVFIRKDMVKMEIPVDIEFSNLEISPTEVISCASKEYNLIHAIEYPFYEDKRTVEEKILDETKFQINRCKNFESFIGQIDGFDKVIIPLEEIFFYTNQYTDSIEKLKNILEKNDYIIKSNNIILEPEEQFSRYGDDLDEPLYGPDYDYIDTDDFWIAESIEKAPQNDEIIDLNEDKNVMEKISTPSECWD